MNPQVAFQLIVRGEFVAIQKRNPHFSLRAFAKKLSLHPGTLSAILNGKRSVSRTVAEKILNQLSITPEQKTEVLSLFSKKQALLVSAADTSSPKLAPCM